MRNSMNAYQQPRAGVKNATVAKFMSRVYLWMVFGLALSAGTAYYIFTHPTIYTRLVQTPALFFGLIIAQFAAVIVLTWLNKRLNATAAAGIYTLYTILTGITLSVVLFVYTKQNVFNALAVTSVAFLGLSAFGYTTKRDLGPIGTFCIMGLFGIIALMFLAIFIPGLRSNTMQMTISAIGVLVFSGLTAYDTQRIKLGYLQSANMTDTQQQTKAAVNGALMLYLDFINLFLSLLRLFGGRR